MKKERPYLPAEWAPQHGVQLTWPHAGTDWLPYLNEITHTYVLLAAAIAAREPLLIVAPHPGEVETLLRTTLDAASLRNIRYFECDTNDTWARDHAFLTLKDGDERILLDFRFNGWGEKFAWEKDNAINRRLHATGIVQGNYEDHGDFVLEGGSIESDGRGTVFTTSQCLLASHRNQPLTQAQIESRLKESLRADRIVWLDHGTLIGDDTDGHIDTIVRTAPHDTLLYVRCLDEGDPQYADFKALEEQLTTLRTPDGKPYRLLPLPMPEPIVFNGERLPATYANFLILNGAVIVPTYDQPDNDETACETIRQAFPDREIIGIDARVIIRQHGSIHCITMQYPR
ncbi:agmatine deiminase family protein [Prevotella sp. KH2C16]|uniref:agmatine deiminase family protein n=1 Tax=Prevotella sp. KH2C16 TaxID=1855325 RepID=UPI0008DEE21F|nr:agmatine deiminase family protein [Prevotella sp. KH2C16]SFG16909.1 Agmatine/peptidylarginine deiminase [Prevotella sp. KH2C16]